MELWDGGKPLAFVTFLGDDLGVSVDSGPKISLPNNFVGERSGTIHKCLHKLAEGHNCLLLVKFIFCIYVGPICSTSWDGLLFWTFELL